VAGARLSDIHIPLQPENDAIRAAKKSPRMRQIVEHIANTGVLLFQAQVAKRSANLAASAHAHTEIGGVHRDMWVGVVTVGGYGARGGVDYALAHEDGRGDHPRSIKNLDGKTVVQHPAHDLNFVLEHLAEYS
jgi:hypothetical protein